jgi:5-methylcytosine-specific restriction endonuclease McrA
MSHKKSLSYHVRNRDRILPILRANARARRLAENPECGMKLLVAKLAKSEARVAGLKHYFTGIPCKHGHVSKRFLSNGQCVECVNTWTQQNPDKYNASRDRWGKNNPEKIRTVSRNNQHRRRCLKRGNGGSYTQDQIDSLLQKQNGRCANSACRKAFRKKYEIDHILPLSKGGSNDITNIQLLCRPCNRRKSAKAPLKWARENGLLL